MTLIMVGKVGVCYYCTLLCLSRVGNSTLIMVGKVGVCYYYYTLLYLPGVGNSDPDYGWEGWDVLLLHSPLFVRSG